MPAAEIMGLTRMAFQYVQKHGRITRRETADLCRLAPRQAGRLLAGLVKNKKLRLHGTKKGAWYGAVS